MLDRIRLALRLCWLLPTMIVLLVMGILAHLIAALWGDDR